MQQRFLNLVSLLLCTFSPLQYLICEESVNPPQPSPSVERQKRFNKSPLLDLVKTPPRLRKSEICFSPDSVFGIDVEVIDLTSDEPSSMSFTTPPRHIRTPRTPQTTSFGHMLSHLQNEPDTPTHRPASSVPQRRKRDVSPQPRKSRSGRDAQVTQVAQISSATTDPGLAFKTPPPTPSRHSPTKPASMGPPKSVTLTPAPNSKNLVSPFMANPSTPSIWESSGTVSPLGTLDYDLPKLIPFSLKTQNWTPWEGSEYFDLSRELLASFDHIGFAKRHNRHPADVLAVFQATVVRPLRQEAEAKKRGESGMAELLALFLDHDTTLRTWAQGSGYEIAGKLEGVFRGEVVVIGENNVGKDLKDGKGTDMISKCGKEKVVIPVQVLSSEDWRYLNLYALNEDQKELLGRPKKQYFRKVEKNMRKKGYSAKPDTSRKKYPFPKTDDIVMMLDDNAMQTAGSKDSTTPPGSPYMSNNCSSETVKELTERIRSELNETSAMLMNDDVFKENPYLFDESGKVKRFSLSGAGKNSLLMK